MQLVKNEYFLRKKMSQKWVCGTAAALSVPAAAVERLEAPTAAAVGAGMMVALPVTAAEVFVLV